MNSKMLTVFEVFNENQLWDNISMMDGTDSGGDHYCIFDGWDDHNSFVEQAKQALEMDPESKDYEVEQELETNFVFSDEYSICDDCGNVVRMSPDSYSWQPDYYIGDGFLVCGSCFRDNEEYQEDYLRDKINNPKSAINGLLEEDHLAALGFSKWNNDSFENGWYDGQNDNPEMIYDKLQSGDKEIIFFIDGVGQFDIHFSVWIR